MKREIVSGCYLYRILVDSSRLAAGFERIFLINYERLSAFYGCKKRAEKSNDDLLISYQKQKKCYLLLFYDIIW